MPLLRRLAGAELSQHVDVTSTNFVARSGVEAGQSTSIPDYDDFVRHTNTIFDGLRVARSGSTSAQVAQVIYEAANDTGHRLRYLATEDIAPLVRARRESSEEAYMALMRANFAPETTACRTSTPGQVLIP